jgi:hypothetical protein
VKFRRRLLSPDQQRELLAAVRARDRLTNKALAAKFGLTEKQLEDQLRAARARENDWPMNALMS